MPDELITVRQAAKLIGIAEGTFYNWISLKKVRYEQGLRRLGRSVRLKKDLLLAAVDSGAFIE